MPPKLRDQKIELDAHGSLESRMPDQSAKPNSSAFLNRIGQSSFARYIVAIGGVVFAWGAREALTPLWGPTALPFIFFYPAIALTAWYGRRGPATLTIILSTLAADWFFIEPRHTLYLHHWSEFIALIAFVVVNGILVAAIEFMHRSNDRVRTELAQRLEVEAQLAAEKELLATTLTSIGDAVLVTDQNGRVTSMNAEAERLTGWSEREASGKSLREIFQILNEQTRQPAENPVDKVLRLGTVTGLANHTVLISRDGRETPIDDSAAPIRHGDSPILGVVLVFRDVTEQHRAQQESARLAAIVESSGDAIFTKDLNGIINTWNRSAQRLFGYEPHEIIGKPVTVLFPPDRLHEEDDILGRLQLGQPSERLETIRMTKDGRPVHVSVSVSPLKNGDTEIIGASKIIQDITELVAAREELTREKELLATTLASIGDGVILTDAEGRVTYLNQEAERLTGWTADEARTHPLNEVFKIINEKTRDTVENPVDKVMRHGGVVGLANHTLLIAKDGREIPIDDSAAPIREPGGPMFGIVLVFRDFTERKQAEQALREREERFRTMANSAPVMIWLSGTDKLCTWFNRQWLEFTGRTMEQELGNGWAEGVHPDDFDRCLKTYVEAFDAREPFSMEYRLRRHDGAWRWILDNGVPVYQANDVFGGYIGSCLDVTERKEQEQRLAEQARLLDFGSDAIVLTNWAKGILYWNRGAEDLYGFTRDEAAGKILHELLQTEFPEPQSQILAKLEQEGVWSGEVVHKSRDGRRINVAARWVLDRDVQGKPRRILKAFNDITARKQVEEALRASQARLSGLIDSAMDAVIAVDAEQRIVLFNPAAEQMFGYPARDVIGSSLDRFIPIALRGAHRQHVANFGDTGATTRRMGALGALSGVRANGDEFPIEASISHMEIGGQKLFTVILRDITERKRVEDNLRDRTHELESLLDVLPAAVWIADDPECRNIRGNQFAQELYGIAKEANVSQTSATARDAVEIPHFRKGRRLNPDEMPMQRAAATGEPQYGEEIEIHSPSGRRIFIGGSAVPLKDGGGHVRGVLAAFSDITARKQAEAERELLLKSEQESRQLAEEANRLKDEFLAIMSHELRNPLNVILGYSELLVRSDEITKSQHLQRMTEAIRRNAVAQSRLIRDLLDLSRLRSGKLQLNRETISIMVSVNNAIETVRSEVEAKQIALDISAPDEALFVEGDPVRLEQIVWNLLNNSVKFTPAGGRISVRVEKEDRDVVLTVGDTGQGIDAAFLPYVFELFRQGDASTSRAQSGMGIGLAVVQQLVDLHKGSIKAASAGRGRGATFTVQLPLSLEPKPFMKPVVDLTTLEKIAVLVVDDSEDTTQMLAHLLKMSGAMVTAATSGDEALRVMAQKEFDVVLSDISMPGMDGFEFLRHLRQLPGGQDLPVLALTGFGRPEDIERAQAEGFFAHVTKPFELEALIEVLQKLPKRNRNGNEGAVN
jgi:PAS domain S-box-containing protein